MWIALTIDGHLAGLPADRQPRPGDVLRVPGGSTLIRRVLDGPDAPEPEEWLRQFMEVYGLPGDWTGLRPWLCRGSRRPRTSHCSHYSNGDACYVDGGDSVIPGLSASEEG